MSSDLIKPVLVRDSRLNGLSDYQTVGVQQGPANDTYQRFKAISSSASNMVFNVTIPSEETVINREVMLSTTVNFTLQSNQPIEVGLSSALNQFAFSQLVQTMTLSINNSTVSTQLQDILPALARLMNQDDIQKYNGSTPTMDDCGYFEYDEVIAANNNPFNAFTSSDYNKFNLPRGCQRFIGTVERDANDNTIMYCSVKLIEPLFISPMIYGNTIFNGEGIFGVNSINLQLALDTSAKRFFTASKKKNENLTITLGGKNGAEPFIDPELLMNFMSIQPTQMVSSKSVLPYTDYALYKSNAATQVALQFNIPQTLQSNNIQLNQLPSRFFIFVRKPMNEMTIFDSNAFLTINNISIQMNTQSGILSSCSPVELWKLSVSNGLISSWGEFSGVVNSLASTNDVKADNPTLPNLKRTSGSMLVLNPAKNLSLPSYLAPLSIGQFSFSFSINVTSYYQYDIRPEICVVCENDGIFVTQQGTSQVQLGLLSKQMVLDTQERNKQSAIGSDEHQQMVGGSIIQQGLTSVKKMCKRQGLTFCVDWHPYMGGQKIFLPAMGP